MPTTTRFEVLSALHGKEWTDDRHVDMGVEALYRTVLKVDEMNF